MSDDILAAIDASIARNRARFDPLGEARDEDRVERFNDGMRVRPASTGSGLSALPVCRGCRDVVLPLPEAKLCGPCSALPSCRAERSNERTGRRMQCFRPAGHEAVHEDYETGSQWVGEENQVEALRLADVRAIDRLNLVSVGPVLYPPPGCEFTVTAQPEPVAPLVDASSDTEVELRRYECHHPGCGWVRVALDLDVFDGLLAEHERTAHAALDGCSDVPNIETRPKFKISDLYAALRARARRGGPR